MHMSGSPRRFRSTALSLTLSHPRAGLDMHVDNSDVTFNVCLGKKFTGAPLNFCGILGQPKHRQFSLKYKHVLGR